MRETRSIGVVHTGQHLTLREEPYPVGVTSAESRPSPSPGGTIFGKRGE